MTTPPHDPSCERFQLRYHAALTEQASPENPTMAFATALQATDVHFVRPEAVIGTVARDAP